MSTETDQSGQILAALERLSSRLDALEAKLDTLPGASSELDQRLLARIDRLEAAIDMVGHLAERVPTLSDAAGDMAGWAYEQAVEAGVDPIEAGMAGARVALKAGRPENIALLERLLSEESVGLLQRLLDNQDLVELLLEHTDTAKAALEAASKIDKADLRVVLEQGASMTGKLAALLQTPELARLLDTGPKAVGVADAASTALVETRGTGADPVGPIGAFMALRDPDVKRAVGFGLAVAKRFGQKIA